MALTKVTGEGVGTLSSSGATTATFNRTTSDGTIVDLQKDGSTVGSIGVQGARLTIGNDAAGLRFHGTNADIYPWNMSTNAINNGGIDLGSAGGRFKDLYLSGGVYLGGTGSANYLDDYEEGSWTPVVSGGTSAGTGTYSNQQGFYTKIGRLVTVNFDYNLTAHTGSGALYIGNLPFSTTSSTGYEALGTLMSHNFNFSTTSPITASLYIGAEQSYMRIYITVDNGAWVQQNLDVAHSIIGSLTYMTDS